MGDRDALAGKAGAAMGNGWRAAGGTPLSASTLCSINSVQIFPTVKLNM